MRSVTASGTRSVHKVKKKANWPLRILVLAGVAFLFIQLWRSQDQLAKKQQEKLQVENDIHTQMVINEDLTAQKEDADATLEDKANEAGYFEPGQQIFFESAG